MGSKQSIAVPAQYYFFQKTNFGSKNCQTNLTFCWFLNFYGNTYGQIIPVLKNLIAGLSEWVKILPKC